MLPFVPALLSLLAAMSSDRGGLRRRTNLRSVLSDAETNDEIERALLEAGALPALELPDRSRIYRLGDEVAEWDPPSTYVRVSSVNEFLEEADVDALFAEDEDRFNEDFWDSPITLYHATTEEAAEDIEVEGLFPMSRTRGLTNRNTGAAVFTTCEIEETAMGDYGPVVYAIDMAAMKASGLTPRVALEDPVAEAEKRSRLAYRLGVDDYYPDVEQGISPHTVVVFGPIPREFLNRLED